MSPEFKAWWGTRYIDWNISQVEINGMRNVAWDAWRAALQQPAQAALSDEQIQEVYEQTVSYIAKDDDLPSIIAFARAILAASQQPATAPTKSEGCAGFQGKPVADCGLCAGAGCDSAPAVQVQDAGCPDLGDAEEFAAMLDSHNLLAQAIAQLDGCMDETLMEAEDVAAWKIVRAAVASKPAVQVQDERAADAERLCKLLEFCTEAKPQFGPKGDLRAMTMKFKNSVETSTGYRRELRKLIDEMQSPPAALTKGQK